MSRLLLVLILTFSGAAVGGALSLVFLPASKVLKGRDRLERLAFDSARIGFAIMVALISEAIARAGRVDSTDWRVYVYLLGSILAGSGYLVLGIRGFARRRKGVS